MADVLHEVLDSVDEEQDDVFSNNYDIYNNMQNSSESNDESHETKASHPRDMIHMADGTESGNPFVSNLIRNISFEYVSLKHPNSLTCQENIPFFENHIIKRKC